MHLSIFSDKRHISYSLQILISYLLKVGRGRTSVMHSPVCLNVYHIYKLFNALIFTSERSILSFSVYFRAVAGKSLRPDPFPQMQPNNQTSDLIWESLPS